MLVKSRIKYIQTLGQKKFREAEGLFIAEGTKIVEELLGAVPQQVLQVYALNEWIQLQGTNPPSFELMEVSDFELEKISQLTTPNQVVAVVRQFEVASDAPPTKELVLVLDDLQDPGNLGTIIRIADWFGIARIICSYHSVDLYNSKVVQASMGSLSRVRVRYTDLNAWLQHQGGVPVYAAVLEGKDPRELGPVSNGILIIGNESKGIHPSLLGNAIEKITIPKRGGAASLNAAVATGIILSHLVP